MYLNRLFEADSRDWTSKIPGTSTFRSESHFTRNSSSPFLFFFVKPEPGETETRWEVNSANSIELHPWAMTNPSRVVEETSTSTIYYILLLLLLGLYTIQYQVNSTTVKSRHQPVPGTRTIYYILLLGLYTIQYQVNSTTVNYNHTVLGKAQTDSVSTTRLDMDKTVFISTSHPEACVCWRCRKIHQYSKWFFECFSGFWVVFAKTTIG